VGLFSGGSSNELEIQVTLLADKAKKAAEELDKSLEKLGEKGKGAGDSLGFLDTSLGKITVGLAAVAGSALALGATLDRGLQVSSLTTGFDSLQASIGRGPDALNQFRQATQGLVSDLDLMQAANQAVLLGVDTGSKAFVELTGAALKLGRAMGIDAKNAIDSLVIGIGRESKLVLDNLGIVVKSEQAYKDYAASIHKSADALTDNEKKLAFAGAAMDAIREKAGLLPDTVLNAGDAFTVLKNQMATAFDQFAVGVTQNDALRDAISSLGGNLSKLDFKTIGDQAGDFAAMVVNLASKVTGFLIPAIQEASIQFDNLKILFSALSKASVDVKFADAYAQATKEATALKEATSQAAEKTNSLREKLASLSSVKDIQKFLKDTTDEIKSLNTSIQSTQDVSKKQIDTKSLNALQTVAGQATARLVELGKKGGKALGGDDGESLKKQADKAAAAILDIDKKIASIVQDNKLSRLKDQFRSALENNNSELARSLEAEIRKATISGLEEGFVLGGNKITDQAREKLAQLGTLESQKITDGIAESVSKGLNKASQNNTPFSNIARSLGLTVTTEMEGIFERLGQGLESNLAGALAQAFQSGDVSQSIENLAVSAAGQVGAAFGGPLGQAIAEIGAQSTINSIKAITSGKQTSDKDMYATAFATGGLSLIPQLAFNSFNNKSPEEEARKKIELFLEETLGRNIDTSVLTDNFSGAFDQIAGDGRVAFEALGSYLEEFLGVGEDVGSQIAFILANDVGGSIDGLKYIVQDLGITFEQMQDQMVAAFLAGDQTAQQVVVALAGIEEAFKPGLAGAGQFIAAMDNLIASMGQGQESLKSLKDLAVEFKETGGKSLAEFRAALESSGKYTADQLNSLFQALSQRGITSLDQLAGASDITLIGIIADLQTLGFQFADSIGGGVQDSIKDINNLRDTINKLPEQVEKSIKIKVSTEYADSNARGALNQLIGNGQGIPRV
jgi:hypothetical protein